MSRSTEKEVNWDPPTDAFTLRWYRRLLVLRHGSIFALLVSPTVGVASPFPWLGYAAGVVAVASGIGFALSTPFLVWPLAIRMLRGSKITYSSFHNGLNVLTGHALLDVPTGKDRPLITRRRIRIVMACDVGLVVLFFLTLALVV